MIIVPVELSMSVMGKTIFAQLPVSGRTSPFWLRFICLMLIKLKFRQDFALARKGYAIESLINNSATPLDATIVWWKSADDLATELRRFAQ